MNTNDKAAGRHTRTALKSATQQIDRIPTRLRLEAGFSCAEGDLKPNSDPVRVAGFRLLPGGSRTCYVVHAGPGSSGIGSWHA
jgi:hypothetical protein